MTRTIRSQSNPNTHYFLTIDDETSLATDCCCGDRTYRHRQCKHMTGFNVEVRKAQRFAAIFAKLDCRANGDEATHRINFEMSLGY